MQVKRLHCRALLCQQSTVAPVDLSGWIYNILGKESQCFAGAGVYCRRKDGCVYVMVALHRSTQPFFSNSTQPLLLCIIPLKVASVEYTLSREDVGIASSSLANWKHFETLRPSWDSNCCPLPELVERLLVMSTLNHTHACTAEGERGSAQGGSLNCWGVGIQVTVSGNISHKNSHTVIISSGAFYG